jgi:iron-sulfur cluster assembly protein
MAETNITLTDRAARHVRDYLARHNSGIGLRVGVKPAGCSGYQYVIEPADCIDERDHVFETQGVKVITDGQSLRYLAGTELDYVREGLKSGFRFNNPNVQESCGCGESFNFSKPAEQEPGEI